MATVYQTRQISPVDALWALIQEQTNDVKNALAERLLKEQMKEVRMKKPGKDGFVHRIQALEGDPEGFFKLGGFMADSESSAESLLSEAIFDKYGF